MLQDGIAEAIPFCLFSAIQLSIRPLPYQVGGAHWICRGVWEMSNFTNSLTMVSVRSRIPTYLQIMAARLSKSTHPLLL